MSLFYKDKFTLLSTTIDENAKLSFIDTSTAFKGALSHKKEIVQNNLEGTNLNTISITATLETKQELKENNYIKNNLTNKIYKIINKDIPYQISFKQVMSYFLEEYKG